MARITNYEGKTLGIWKVLKQTQDRDSEGRVIYICENTKTKQKANKTSNYLSQVVKYGCKSTKRGRPRKWTIIKVPFEEGKEVIWKVK